MCKYFPDVVHLPSVALALLQKVFPAHACDFPAGDASDLYDATSWQTRLKFC